MARRTLLCKSWNIELQWACGTGATWPQFWSGAREKDRNLFICYMLQWSEYSHSCMKTEVYNIDFHKPWKRLNQKNVFYGTFIASTCGLARLKAILMLEWDEHSDNRATSLVNKRWAHEPQGGESVYFGAKVWLIFLSALHVTLTYTDKCFQSHSLPFIALCRHVTV